MKMKVFTYLACFAIVGQLGVSAEANTIFDNFEQNQVAPSDDQAFTFVDSGLGGATALRDLNVTSGGGSFSIDHNVAFQGVEDELFILTSGTGPHIFSLVYENITPNFNLDWVDRFILGGVTGNTTASIVFSVVDGSSNTSSFSDTVVATASSQDVLLSVSGFTGTADFSDVDQLSLTVTVNGNFQNFQIDTLSAVSPEPSGLILAGLAVIALFGFSYFRKQQAVAVEA